MTKKPRFAHLARICVDPLVSSHGLGTALVADAIEHSRAGGFARLDLEVRTTNSRAIALYRRAGFTVTSPPWDYDGGDPVATWCLDLTIDTHASLDARRRA